MNNRRMHPACARSYLPWILLALGNWGAQPLLGQTRPITLPPPTTTNNGQASPALQQSVPQPAAVPDGLPNGSVAPNSAGLPNATAAPTGVAAPSGASAGAERDSLESMLQLVAERQQQLAADTERSAEVKEALTKQYEQTRLELEAALKARQKREERTANAAAAPALLDAARMRKEEESTKPSSTQDDFRFLSFEEVDSKRRELEAQLATSTAERTALSERSANREKRRKELPQLLSDAKAKLEALNGQPSPPSAGDDAWMKEATEWAHEAVKRNLMEQIQLLESEQRLHEAEASLLPLQLELAQNAEKRLQDRVRVVHEQLDRIRTNRILAKYSQAKTLVDGLPPNQKAVGQALLKRIEAWMELANKQAQLKTELDTARKLFDRWNDRRTRMKSRIDPKPGQEGGTEFISGFNSWVGLMLRKQRSELPDPDQLAARIRYYQDEMQLADSLLFTLEDALLDTQIQQEGLQLDQADREALPNAPPRLSDKLAALLKENEEIIQTIKIDVNAYLTDLYDIADVRENTIELTEDYRDFIDKHVLWIRSTEPLSSDAWQPGVEAFRWLVDYGNWRNVGRLLYQDVRSQIIWYVVFILGIIVFVSNQSRLRRRLSQFSAQAEKNNCTKFVYTARGLVLTLLIALPLPLSLIFIYWRLETVVSLTSTAQGEGEFATALAHGMLLAACVFLPMELLRQLCRPGGLGIKHFGWRESSARRLRSNLRWLIDFTIPLTIINAIFLTQNNARWESSFGRLAFVIWLPLLSLFLARIFAPKSGIVSGLLESRRDGWLDRLSLVWYPTLIAFPLALAIVSLIGYHYTAQRIAFHLIATLWTVVLLTVAHYLMMRWLVLNRRRLMLAQARQRLKEAARRDPQSDLVGVEEPRIDLVAINEQTRRLVSSMVVTTGFIAAFFIWSEVLPAVSMLDGIELWEIKGDGPDETVPITLANLLLVIPILILAIIAGRNVPGLLEIAFLQHLPLTTAARYAITTLSRYAIAALGIVFVSSTIGLRWSSIQWLVAALGVGLGFGLQEIFANFVSGLILLFEQPIRVGDIISVDGTTGTVTKIRMRATTIINWDRQELVVPNKDFITGKLLNWTLTDSTNRIMLNVGVAYGSDTRRACELIMDVCTSHPNVLRDPRPSVTFEGFGDNSLNITLRAFLDSLDNRLLTIHELHQQVYQTFNEAGIEIAFPQRDLHLRSLPESVARFLTNERRQPPTDTTTSPAYQKDSVERPI